MVTLKEKTHVRRLPDGEPGKITEVIQGKRLPIYVVKLDAKGYRVLLFPDELEVLS